MSKPNSNKSRKLFYMYAKLTGRNTKTSYLIPPPPPKWRSDGINGLNGPTRRSEREGEGEPGRATGRIGVGTSPDAGCRASRPAAAVSVRASKLPSVVRLQQSLRRPAVPPRPVVLRLGQVLSQRASVLPFYPPSHCLAAPLEKIRSSALPTPHSARRRAFLWRRVSTAYLGLSSIRIDSS